MTLFPNDDTTREFIAAHYRRRRLLVTEDAILAVFAAPRSKHDVYWGVLALRDVGTTRCVSALKKLLHCPMQDVKDCSILTIAHIAGPAETLFYLDALADTKTRKLYPMWAIEVAADERALPAVTRFVKKALSKASRGTALASGDAYFSGLRFLARIGWQRTDCQATLVLLRSVWDKLPEGHRKTIRDTLPPELVPA